MLDFIEYIKALKVHKPEEVTEHTLRPELQKLLVCFKQEMADIKS